MGRQGISHESDEDGAIVRQRFVSFLLTILITMFLVVGGLNGIWMTMRFLDQAQAIAKIRRDVEINRSILDGRTEKIDRLIRETERNRKAIEKMMEGRAGPNSP